MMSVVVMRHEVETAMDEHAPRKNDDSLGVQQIIPNPQGDQNQWDGVKEVKESLPRLREVSRAPEFTLWCLTDEAFDDKEDEHR